MQAAMIESPAGGTKADARVGGDSAQRVILEGQAFGPVMRYSVLVVALLAPVATWVVYRQAGTATGGFGWWIAALGVLLLFSWAIWTSRTRVERAGDDVASDVLVQSWVGDKRAAVAEIAYARFVYYPQFKWLMAPRLYLVLVGGRITAIYLAADPLYEYAADIEKRFGRRGALARDQ
jgi:hypothetical protein